MKDSEVLDVISFELLQRIDIIIPYLEKMKIEGATHLSLEGGILKCLKKNDGL